MGFRNPISGHQLHQRHHVAPEGRHDHAPQRLDEFRRHAHALAHDAGRPLSVDAPMFHANGWTFTWTVTAAAAAHVCLRKVDAAEIYEHGQSRARHASMCGADGAHRDRERAGGRAARDCGEACKCSPPVPLRRPPPIERLETELGWEVHACLRAHRDRAFHFHLRAVTRDAALCEPIVRSSRPVRASSSSRPGELRVVDESMQDVPRTGRRSAKSSPAATW